MSKDTSYTSKAKINAIRATSRASVKIRESYFTIEYSEERLLPDDDTVNIEEERRILWEEVNAEVDNQIVDIEKSFK